MFLTCLFCYHLWCRTILIIYRLGLVLFFLVTLHGMVLASVSLLKKEVKNLSRVDWTSLFFRMFLKWFRHLSSTKAQSLFISALLGCQRLKFFPVVTHIQTEKISSWNGSTVHICCFMLARASTKTFISWVRKTAKKSSLAEKFVRRVTR